MAATENPFRVPGFEDDSMDLFSDQMPDLDPSVLQPGPYYGGNFDLELNNISEQPVAKVAPQTLTTLRDVTKPMCELMALWDAQILDLTAQNQRLGERLQNAESKFESKMAMLSQAWSEHYEEVKTSIFRPMMQLKKEVAKMRGLERDPGGRHARYTRSSNQT